MLRAKLFNLKEQRERRLKELQEAYGEAMLAAPARIELASQLGEEDRELVRSVGDRKEMV